MKQRFGIMTKFFWWYFVIIAIFSGTIIVLFLHIHLIIRVSDKIVNNRYKLSFLSKRMINNLLTMEENEKKYQIIEKPEYRTYYLNAQEDFKTDLMTILNSQWHLGDDRTWEKLYADYVEQQPPAVPPDKTVIQWLPSDTISDWIKSITRIRIDNLLAVEQETKELHEQGLTAVRWGMVGFGASILFGLFGILFLARSMSRPLRELRRGIRSLSREGFRPIAIKTRDEFGDLARAFNEMAMRLGEEERMRADFISMLSHEIRTPLTSIRESVNLVADEVAGNINERQRRLLEIASEESERLTDLLNHLMQVVRMEAGILEVRPCPMDPAKIIADSVPRILPLAESKGVRLFVSMPEKLPQVMADPDHFPQVLLNLLGNAVKFSPQGAEVRIRLRTGKGNRLIFGISDMGIGIPEEEQAMVFDKYYRASGSKDQFDGMGLGLNISKNIVEAHGGAIWIQSRQGEGSTFFFSIPTADRERQSSTFGVRPPEPITP
jgi:signal transduction histidine kinase